MARLWFDYHKSYFCRDCIYCFTIHNKVGRGKPKIHCPNCGDSIAVESFKPPLKKQNEKRPWTDEELDLIERLEKSELLIYQVAIKINRTPKAVRNRLSQWRKGFQRNENVR